jgi:hypothetical protein
MSKKGQPYFNNVTTFSLSRPILLVSMWAGNTMCYTNFCIKGIQPLILATPICLN